MKKGKVTLSILYFILSIVIGSGLAIFSYYLSKKYEFDTNLTAYVAVIGSVPTAYLWIVKERKKEKQLENKEKELLQSEVSELNKVYVDAVNQFYDTDSSLAGLYALNGLLNDWIGLLINNTTNKQIVNTKIEQIVSIISSDKVWHSKKDTEQGIYDKLIGDIVLNLVHQKKITEEISISWSKFNLQKADLVWADLEGADLEGVHLEKANLYRANLYRANLSGAHLQEALLEGALLAEANLSNAYLAKANLSNIDLTKANLTEANLAETFLPNSDLSGAHLETVNLEKAYLSEVNLSGAHLEGALLEGANLSGAYFGGAHLEGAYFGGAHLEGAYLGGAYLGRADLEGAHLLLHQISKLDSLSLKNVKKLNFYDEESNKLDNANAIKKLEEMVQDENTLIKGIDIINAFE